jgi:hypothetical protein
LFASLIAVAVVFRIYDQVFQLKFFKFQSNHR